MNELETSNDNKIKSNTSKQATIGRIGENDIKHDVFANINFEKYESIREIIFHCSFSMESLGEETFCCLTDLRRIKITKNVKTIGIRCFKGLKMLEMVVFDADSQLTMICESAFYECESLNHIDLPISVTNLGKKSFSKSGLTSIDFGNSECKH